ncbi:MAG TPA: hypothetical protein VMY69_08665, partial [Phycisphaerae bacterium]|nr:hypothetical protein [Phycisphaerae bacterium]
DVATADARLSGALVTADTQTGRASAIERLSLPISPGTAGMPGPDGEPAAKNEEAEPSKSEPADAES